MNDIIIANIRENILRITLNNSVAQNTLSLDVINQLKKIIEDADKNNEIKIIILSSSGKVFCAGHNLKEINNHRNDSDKGLKYFTTLINNCSELMLKIIYNTKPVIAEVLEGTHIGEAQYALLKEVPLSANASKFGVSITSSPEFPIM